MANPDVIPFWILDLEFWIENCLLYQWGVGSGEWVKSAQKLGNYALTHRQILEYYPNPQSLLHWYNLPKQ